jgi:dCTP deaminase
VVLSDRTIKELVEAGRIEIDPYDPARVQPSSVDLRLGDRIRVFTNTHRRSVVDLRQPSEDLTELVTLEPDKPFILHPHEFVLGITSERVGLPDDVVGRIEGKSSLGRLGLMIHSTAGFVDPGWRGRLTLELANILNLPITLYAGMLVAQISFMQLSTPADRPYGSPLLRSKYWGDTEPTPSKYHLNFSGPPEG